ncbi:MAG: AsmA-like C-terminal domain-containing protein [Pseudomonadota bacterium]|nr:AsmA-like C-terminal domain-containing protein [Pseudomonadota bacterium]
MGAKLGVFSKLAITFGFLIVFLVGIVTWRLMQGPVILPFLSNYIENALNERGGPVQFTIKNTSLAWSSWERTLNVRLVQLSATNEKKQVITSIPQISVKFSFSALLQGVLAPTSLELLEPRIKLVRGESGLLTISLDNQTMLPADIIGGLIRSLSGSETPERPTSFIRNFSIVNANLEIHDKIREMVWRLPKTNLNLTRQNDKIRAIYKIQIGKGSGWGQIEGQALWDSDKDFFKLQAGVQDLQITRVTKLIPKLVLANYLDFTLNGQVNMEISLDGLVKASSFNLRAKGAKIKGNAFWPNSLNLESLAVKGRYHSDPEFFEIDNLQINTNGPKISVKASLVNVEEEITVNGDTIVNELVLSQLKKYWPPNIGRDARNWVSENMQVGTAEEIRMSFSLRIPLFSKPRMFVNSLSGSLKLRDVTINYMDTVPVIENLHATAVFTSDRFVASITEANSGGLQIRSGTVRLLDLSSPNEKAVIDVNVSGLLKNAFAIMDKKPLNLISKYKIKPEKVGGWINSNLKFLFPLKNTLKPSLVKINSISQVINADLPDNGFRKHIKSGHFNVRVNESRLLLSGDAKVAGTSVVIKWEENFKDRQEFTSRYDFQAVLDEAARESFGFNAFETYLSGKVSVNLKLLKFSQGSERIDVKIGLKGTSLSFPTMNWEKKLGEFGIISFSIFSEISGPVSIQNFELITTDLEVRGNADFDNSWEFLGGKISNFSLGKSNFRGTILPNENNGYALKIVGASLDANRLFQTTIKAEEDYELPSFSLDFILNNVWFNEEKPVRDIAGIAIFDENEFKNINIKGHVGFKNPFKFILKSGATEKRFILSSNDAGEFLKDIDVIKTMRGGKLRVVGSQEIGSEGPWMGNFTISNFMMVDAPLLARMLSLASLTGIFNTLSGKGIKFVQLHAPFSYTEGIAKIKNARAVGSQLGITAEGDVDVDENQLNIKGTIVPAYSLNSVPGMIPLLGLMFTGGEKGSGVFAATYEIDGQFSDPDVLVNPLAALTPGFLRNLFNVFGIGSLPK